MHGPVEFFGQPASWQFHGENGDPGTLGIEIFSGENDGKMMGK
jgi:hypothetical protein